MGKYLDSLTAEFDEINAGIDVILDRAADENREVTKDELEAVNRDKSKVEELKKAIDHYSELEVTRSKVAETRNRMPAAAPQRTSTAVVVERDQDPHKELLGVFPTAGDYLTTAAMALRGDRTAAEKIGRGIEILERDTTTQHQTTADNPGLLPRPILGPIITLVNDARPFIQSISPKPLPAEKFDRPKITQHVAVGKQTAEKQLTESRKLKVDNLPVAASTYAGHLNVSRQDIKWSKPALMNILAEDFAHEYALETDADAVAQFTASVTDGGQSITLDTWDLQPLRAALFAAAAAPYKTGEPAAAPDTFWMSADVWAYLGSQVNANGVPYFPGLQPGSVLGGDILGYKPVVDPYFPPGTAVIGKGGLCEWYEDLDGLLQVDEPDVLGQLVGYAGYGAFLNTSPQVYTVLTLPAVPELTSDAVAARAAAKPSSK